jgi:hypothetical protein
MKNKKNSTTMKKIENKGELHEEEYYEVSRSTGKVELWGRCVLNCKSFDKPRGSL